MRTAAGRWHTARISRTKPRMATIIAARTDRDCANAPCTTSAMMCFTPMSSPACNTDAEKWVGLMRQYVNPTELTAELLNTLIEKIFVHEAVKGEDGSREQEVEIFYRFIGKID